MRCGRRSTVSRWRPASGRLAGSAPGWTKRGTRSITLPKPASATSATGSTTTSPPLVSLPYSVQTNDVPAYFEMKVSVPEFEAMLRRQFDTLYHEGETIPRVMAIALHPYIIGVAHRIGALDAALEYISRHEGVWLATGGEICDEYRKVISPS